MNLFENPIKSVKVRKNIYAHLYRNGCINIAGTKYFDYSIKEAIKIYRRKNPLK